MNSLPRSFFSNGVSVYRPDTQTEQAGPVSGNGVMWCHDASDLLPRANDLSKIFERADADGANWIEHWFGAEGTTNIMFSVSGDGARVISRARLFVPVADVFRMFDEVVMRTVLARKGWASFHASALYQSDTTVLLMGNSGAGKSTLSAALTIAGWSVMADDLVRAELCCDTWEALAGTTESKINADSAAALGIEHTEPQWTDAKSIVTNKRIIARPDGDEPGNRTRRPIDHVVLLQPRGQADAELSIARSTLSGAIAGLLRNRTLPPLLWKLERPTAATLAMVEGVARQASVWEVSLPDSFARLQDSAYLLDRHLTSPATANGVVDRSIRKG